ncbi:MAG TPA: GntR family transcriptional regulator [Bryobacteraceae bacterium]|nr:GntR family transcriptional regulator [Bryobacteraceae bacterium]
MKRRAAPAARRRSDASIREKAYLHIQRKIAAGELRAGRGISEVALARELGSSRTPVREALGQLVAEGLLEQTPNRGAVVKELTRQDIIDLYELREALELYAVRKAALQAPRTADLERLQELADEVLGLRDELAASGQKVLDARQMHRFMASDLGFHAMLMRMAANARILKLVNETRLLMRIFSMRHRSHNRAELERIHRQHCDLLRAVADQDAARAVELLSEHIQASQRERLEEFDYRERENSLRESVPAFFYGSPPVEEPVRRRGRARSRNGA